MGLLKACQRQFIKWLEAPFRLSFSSWDSVFSGRKVAKTRKTAREETGFPQMPGTLPPPPSGADSLMKRLTERKVPKYPFSSVGAGNENGAPQGVIRSCLPKHSWLRSRYLGRLTSAWRWNKTGNGGLEYYYSKRTANSRLAILCEKVAKMIFRKTRCCTNQLESDYTCVTWWERRGLRG